MQFLGGPSIDFRHMELKMKLKIQVTTSLGTTYRKQQRGRLVCLGPGRLVTLARLFFTSQANEQKVHKILRELRSMCEKWKIIRIPQKLARCFLYNAGDSLLHSYSIVSYGRLDPTHLILR